MKSLNSKNKLHKLYISFLSLRLTLSNLDASAREKTKGGGESETQSSLNSLMEAVGQHAEGALESFKEMLESVKEFAPQLSSILQAFLGKSDKDAPKVDPKKQPSPTPPINPPNPEGHGPFKENEPKTIPKVPGLTPEERASISANGEGKTRDEKRKEDLARYAVVAKIPSIEELSHIPKAGDRVVAVAEELMRLDVRGKHCWDWVDVVYYAAGVKRKGVFSSFKNYEGRDCGKNHADENLVDHLEPGDHIFINNRNKTDAHGNHSVIFMRWRDKNAGIAELAQLPRGGKTQPKIMTKNIRHDTPVTFINKPINA